MAEISVVRKGTVQYKAGYRQDGRTPGQQPVYREARVVQYSDGSISYFPPTAAVAGWNTDGGCELPERLIDSVRWES